MEDPSAEHYSSMQSHKMHLKFLKKELSIMGLPVSGYFLFYILSFCEIALIVIYFYLAINKNWILG